MAISFEIAGAQIDGAREYQEDAFLITYLSDADGHPSALVIVADGMGGHAAGNVASNMAVQALNKHVTANYPTDTLSEVLTGAVLKANNSIAETVKETPALEGMGCTMVATVFEKESIWWASVGDSNLYLMRNRELQKINADHSYGGFLDRMAAAGTPVDAEPGLSRNMLMSAITGSDISDIDCPITPLQLKAGDKILITSDGLDTLSDGKIIQYTDWSKSPKECADALLNAVEEAGMPKQDNTTVIVVHIVDKEVVAAAPPPPEPEEEEDITDRTGAAQAAASAAKTAAAQESAQAEILEIRKEPGGKAGLIVGIAAGIIIITAIAGFFIFSGKKTVAPEVTEPVQITETEEVEETIEEKGVAEAPPDAEKDTEAQAEAEPEAAKIEEVEKPVEPAAKTEEIAKLETKPESKLEAQATAAISKEFRDALKEGGTGPEMVWLPAGTFEMGSPSSSSMTDERPRHTVKINKIAISKHEITFAEYDKFANATDRKLPDNLYMERETHPVIFVSWDDAYYYTKWLSEQSGKKYRLATEAEWEYAASGGINAPFWWGFNEEPSRAHCFGCSSQFDPRKPAKIGSFEPNQFGIYDTAGNVAEWVQDCWHDNYDGAPTDGGIWEGGDCSLRIARGGSYNSPPQSIRRMKRDKFKSDAGYDLIGIRIVRDAE
ncbi:MAG: SUMF1/EgtB/PvdO family nonheme iron enzyme [Gammaproteobacteria bacterium]|nr:SUMF1/EgtB/PvdO family nonheme iron enzyme [Gammaproteobacteria bacterium]